MVLCYTCKNMIGIDMDGYVYCARLGRVRPLVMCRFYEARKGEKGGGGG